MEGKGLGWFAHYGGVGEGSTVAERRLTGRTADEGDEGVRSCPKQVCDAERRKSQDAGVKIRRRRPVREGKGASV